MHDSLDRKGTFLRIAAVLAWAGIILFVFLHRSEITLDGILSYASDSPLLAAAVLMGLFVLKSMTFVFYSGALYAASGLLFSLPAAIVLNVCGTALMVSAPYLLARSLGAPYAESLRKKYPKLRRVEQLRTNSDLAFVTLLRSVKLVNFDLGSMYLGAVGMPLRRVLLGSLAGMSPEIVLFPIVGASLDDPHSSAFWISLGISLTISAVMLCISIRMNRKKESDKHEP